MLSNKVAEVFSVLDAAVAAVGAVDWETLPAWERVEAMERLEAARRRAIACAYDVAAAVDRCDDTELGGVRCKLIADVLRITTREARRRLNDAAQLRPRTTLAGSPLPPALPATAKAWKAGLLDVEHLRVIQKFHRDLPVDINPSTTEKAEAFLAGKAAELRPDQLEKVADRLALDINPDGTFSDEFRSRRRGFSWSPQRRDGISIGTLTATPELRAMIDALFAKFAAPGMCNPADQSATVGGEPSQEVADRDARSMPQRQHDALAALTRSMLGDAALGQHNGLPVTIIATATLEQLCSGSGWAATGGGTRLPMGDVIRMAAHSWHYLAIFDKHLECPLYLGRTRRIASADQRIVLHAKERGCTFPGCDAPGYLSQVHHVEQWCRGGLTNIDQLTFACKPHHRLIAPGGWATRKQPNGTTEWIPPPRLPLPGGVNDYHNPERTLGEQDPTRDRP